MLPLPALTGAGRWSLSGPQAEPRAVRGALVERSRDERQCPVRAPLRAGRRGRYWDPDGSASPILGRAEPIAIQMLVLARLWFLAPTRSWRNRRWPIDPAPLGTLTLPEGGVTRRRSDTVEVHREHPRSVAGMGSSACGPSFARHEPAGRPAGNAPHWCGQSGLLTRPPAAAPVGQRRALGGEARSDTPG